LVKPLPDKALSVLNLIVIDDDELMLRSISSVLSDLGATVNSFTEPLKALDWFKTNGADIVVADVNMPVCDGFEVLSRVKEIDSQCEVILITGQGEIENAIRAMRQGAADFFVKPFDIVDLRAAVERTSRYLALSQQRSLLSARVDVLSRELSHRKGARNVMVGQSPAMKEVTRSIVELSDSTATVLICGESGTGKELVACAIHRASPRSGKPMLTINCAAIPDNLFESEMFGHRRGAFTGANETRIGYVAAAEGGILFLDEIGDLPLHLQGKILRLLEQKTYLPVGDVIEKTADIRLIAATNQSLDQLVLQGRFRQDLYYRLNVCTINIPPLRERREDIPLLAMHLGLLCASELGRPFNGIEDDALKVLSSYDLNGNVRELRNIIENAIMHCRHSGKLSTEDLPLRMPGTPGQAHASELIDPGRWPLDTLRLDEVERRLYLEALKRTGCNISAASKEVGLTRSKFRRRLAALKIETHRSADC